MKAKGKKRLWWKGRVESESLPSVRSSEKKEYESYILIDFAKKDKEIEMYFETYLNDLDTFFYAVANSFWKKTYGKKITYYF